MSGVNRTFGYNRDEELPQYPPSVQTTTTANPMVDDYGPSAVGGGISNIALGVANKDAESDSFKGPPERGYNTTGSDNPYIPFPPPGARHDDALRTKGYYGSNNSPEQTPHTVPSNPFRNSYLDHPYQKSAAYQDGPYERSSYYYRGAGPLDIINPDEIADDGDDGFGYASNDTDKNGTVTSGKPISGRLRKSLAGFGRNRKDLDTIELTYDAVPGKSQAQKYRGAGNKRRGCIVGFILAFIVIGAIVGGIVGGLYGNRGNVDRTKHSRSVFEPGLFRREHMYSDNLDKKGHGVFHSKRAEKRVILEFGSPTSRGDGDSGSGSRSSPSTAGSVVEDGDINSQ